MPVVPSKDLVTSPSCLLVLACTCGHLRSERWAGLSNAGTTRRVFETTPNSPFLERFRKMLSILRKARLKDKEMRILLL